MTLALKYGSTYDPQAEQGFIYFDAVTEYARTYSGQVTSHPIANGAVINDHYTRENPVFRLQAVISGVDITTWTSLLRSVDDEAVYNYYSNTPVSIDENSDFTSLIPDSIGQFFQRDTPSVEMDQSRTDLTSQVEAMMIKLMEGFVEDANTGQVKTNIQTVSLYEFDGLNIRSVVDNLVITNLNFTENTQTGTGLFFDITFTKVNFVELMLASLPQSVVNSLTVTESSKGKQDSTSKDMSGNDIPEEPKRIDPLRATQISQEKRIESARLETTGIIPIEE